MNFLAHIYLSGDDEDLIIGNFIADAIKGKKYQNYPPKIQRGILLHREIDTFTDSHPVVHKSTAKLHANYSHYSGVIVDVLYDHFLAKNWNQYHPEPLEEFIQKFYSLLRKRLPTLPARIQRLTPYMIADNWLLSYATVEGIGRILAQMNVRTNGVANMDLAVNELKEYYDEFQKEFTVFFAELQKHTEKTLSRL
ncbi:MAG TPA: ACP phosphodiesterase [Flavobacteriaceae bacterium]|nr:ACP phosphodiesterase [Flavobacteriaceae bacterium]